MPAKTESKENLVPNEKDDDPEKGISDYNITSTDEYVLTETEKKFILAVERGDSATTKRIIDENRENPEEFNINCLDPLNRSALISSIENENEDLISLLLEEGIQVGDALLHAISEEYVEAVEELLQWEEENHIEGTPYSWEAVDRSKSDFTPDITPLILAAHRNNYEILKILLDRGASLPMPHDVKCGCDVCIKSQQSDSLRHSQSRINAYKALSASSLIALSSRDPVLTAFELSWELKHLQTMESEFRDAYTEMRQDVQTFVSSLLDHARTSTELEIMLNFNPDADTDIWMPGQRQTLERLKLAIKYKQKAFVAHPNVQQLLAAIWYDGLPGFRRKTLMQQLVQVGVLGCSFPIYSMNYIVAPNSEKALFMRKPFVKFIMHSTSYMFFLMLLAGASLRIIPITFELIGLPWMLTMLDEWKKYERGSLPGPIELFIIMYIGSLIFGELKALYDEGLFEYICDLWNIVDFIQNSFYVTWILMRITSWVIAHRDLWYRNINPYFPRENWHPFDPMLIAEGAFAAGMIFSFLKLVHIFSINPHLGPLQVSLGRMIIDIIKFFFIYTLVLFAFGCGFNLLLMYYADMEKKKCYHLHPEVADFDDQEKACTIWRRFANLFETSQSLFWASFGLVDLVSFELAGMKGFTRFWGLLMFGSYSVINIIVLLNMLIAMMSNSYQVIYEKADTEWKFARSQLWMSYFEDGGTLPPPFNMCPSIKMIQMTLGKQKKRTRSILRKTKEKAQQLHDKVMRLLIRRYVTCEQRKRDDFGITEDDIIEVRSDISSFRFELLDILKQNRMKVPDIDKKLDSGGMNKKTKVLERRIKKDFQIGIVESLQKEMSTVGGSKDVFSSIAKVIGMKKESIKSRGQSRKEKKNWNDIVKKNFMSGDPIGSSRDRATRQSQRSLRRKIIDEENKKWTEIDQENLLKFNPRLHAVKPATRAAYVKFMKPTLQKREELAKTESEAGPSGSKPDGASAVRKPTIRQAVSYKTSEKRGPPPPPSDAQAQKAAAPGAPGKPGEQPKSDGKGAAPVAPGGAKPDASKTEPSKVTPDTGKKPEPPKSGDTKTPDQSKPASGGDQKKAPDQSKSDAPKPAGGDSKKPETGSDKKNPNEDASKSDPTKPGTGGANEPKKVADTPSGGDKGGGEKPASGDKPADKPADKPGDKPAGGAAASGGAGAAKPADKKPETKTPAATSAAMSTAAAGAAGDRGKSVVTGKMISGWL